MSVESHLEIALYKNQWHGIWTLFGSVVQSWVHSIEKFMFKFSAITSTSLETGQTKQGWSLLSAIDFSLLTQERESKPYWRWDCTLIESIMSFECMYFPDRSGGLQLNEWTWKKHVSETTILPHHKVKDLCQNPDEHHAVLHFRAPRVRDKPRLQ